MRDRHLVPREESRVAVAFRAGFRELLCGHQGPGLARGFHFVDRPMARSAAWSIRIALRRSLSMDAVGKLLDLLSVALGAFGGRESFRGGQFVHAAVTRSASVFAKHRVHTASEGLCFRIMTRGTLDFRNLCRMREFLDGCVAIGTTENGVGAGRML